MGDPAEPWPLILRVGFGDVQPCGRWSGIGLELLAIALSSDEEGDWALVIAWSEQVGWEDTAAS